MILRYGLILLLIFPVFSGCNSEDNIISEELYITVFTELALLNQMNDERFPESEKEQIRSEIFENYDLSEEEFRISHEFYERQTPEQIARMDTVSVRLRQIRDEIDQAQREYKQRQDSLRQLEEGEEEDFLDDSL